MSFQRLLVLFLLLTTLSTSKGLLSTPPSATVSKMTTSSTSAASDENSDNLAPWNDRWKEGRINFHHQDVHHSLLKWGNRVIPQFSVPAKEENNAAPTCSGESARVFVPLSGKTVDMAFLAQEAGVSEVIGLEGIRQALDEFADENPSLEIKPVENATGPFDVLKGKKVTLLKGDYFDLDLTSSGGPVNVVWDRGSLVAIEPSLRERYVAILSKVMAPGGVILFSSFERREGTPEALASGPPYSIVMEEVQRLFPERDWEISQEEIDAFAFKPETQEFFGKKGITSLYEVVYFIKKRES